MRETLSAMAQRVISNEWEPIESHMHYLKKIKKFLVIVKLLIIEYIVFVKTKN